jgi:hypothetical protein
MRSDRQLPTVNRQPAKAFSRPKVIANKYGMPQIPYAN